MEKTIEISEDQYIKLLNQAKAYQKLREEIFESVLDDNIDQVVSDFRDTEIYSEEFLRDLGDGLKKSSYFKGK